MPTFRFHGELNDFLPRASRHRALTKPMTRRAGIKDVVEALGVPHTEMSALAIDGHPGALTTILDADSDTHVEVHPNAPGHASALRPPLPWPPSFVLDTHLGRLARYLRLLGLDSRYHNDCDDPTLARIADSQNRILLTRDRGLLKRARVVFARFVRDDDPLDQLEDIFRHFRLNRVMAPFTRCSHCNTPLTRVAKADIVHELEPGTRRHYQRFSRCPNCGRLYWRGSHHHAMQTRIDALLRTSP